MRKPKLNAQSTTFGIKMGDPPRKFGGKITKGSDFVYKCEKVRRPHPNREKYYVWSYPETGIAWIESVGFKHQNDSYGKSFVLGWIVSQNRLHPNMDNGVNM